MFPSNKCFTPALLSALYAPERNPHELARKHRRHRRALTVKLFTGTYRGTIDDLNVPRVLFALGKRLLR